MEGRAPATAARTSYDNRGSGHLPGVPGVTTRAFVTAGSAGGGDSPVSE